MFGIYEQRVVIIMKYINRPVRTLVDFKPGIEPVPVFFVHEGRKIRVDRIISKEPVRRTFSNCVLYKCESGQIVFELRWDRHRDRWFIEKLGV
jgi:hypothetical protein